MAWGALYTLPDTRAHDLSPLAALTQLKKLHITGLALDGGRRVCIRCSVSLILCLLLSLPTANLQTQFQVLGVCRPSVCRPSMQRQSLQEANLLQGRVPLAGTVGAALERVQSSLHRRRGRAQGGRIKGRTQSVEPRGYSVRGREVERMLRGYEQKGV